MLGVSACQAHCIGTPGDLLHPIATLDVCRLPWLILETSTEYYNLTSYTIALVDSTSSFLAYNHCGNQKHQRAPCLAV